MKDYVNEKCVPRVIHCAVIDERRNLGRALESQTPLTFK